MPDESPRPEGPKSQSEQDLHEALERMGRREVKFAGAGKYAGVGIQFAAAILLFLWAGQWADRKLGTDPLFLYLGVFSGAGAAFYSMYRSLMADQRREDEERARAKRRREGGQ